MRVRKLRGPGQEIGDLLCGPNSFLILMPKLHLGTQSMLFSAWQEPVIFVGCVLRTINNLFPKLRLGTL